MSLEQISIVGPQRVNAVTDVQHLGTRVSLPDLDYSAQAKTRLSAEQVECILVANRSGGDYTPGLRVGWLAGEEGPGRATGAAGGDDLPAAGIVWPYYTVNVADDDFFLLVVKGPTKAQYDGAGDIAVGDPLKGAASGRFSEYTDGTDQVVSLFGHALAAKSSGSAGDLVRVRVNFE